MDKMAEKIVLLEFTDEAEAFLKYCKDKSVSAKDFRIIALQPQVQVFLKSKGIPYENTLSYFTNQSHARALMQSEKWYRFLAERISIEDGTEIRNTYNDSFLFFFRLYINYFLFQVEILTALINKYEVESISACFSRNVIKKNDNPLIQNNERYVGMIAKIFSENYKISFKEIPISLGYKAKNSRRFCYGFLDRFFFPLLIGMYLYFLRLFLSRRKTVLFASEGYNIGKIAHDFGERMPDVNWVIISEEIGCKQAMAMIIKCLRWLLGIAKRDGTSIVLPIKSNYYPYLPRLTDRQKLLQSIDHLLSRFKFDWNKEFVINGVNFIDIIIDRLDGDLKPYLIDLYLKSVIMKHYFSHLDLKLVISPFARSIYFMIGELCKKRLTPTLMIAHGPIAKPRNEFECIENYHLGKTLLLSDVYDCIALQTPSEEEHYEYYRNRETVEEKLKIITGPIVLSKIK
jgi:hypothetical protein